ncbi:hypothetical protein [Microtetraspora sp. NBRC 16547]|uniref:hypothetical protein n=1 Tax=Microtetraspora sp. NBRC 16547 TaxID=3030993 RepID=UPI0024A467C2|nr:hypothetical protein [Microtetraspora sp. NBRC 16547]GLW98207.1 hypothetical protein Misp02_22940 [Microtetraspora sp. NBRC 16547]
MTKVSWYSQPFPPEGASAAEGIRKQLGRPELDLLTILVRESAQNSWDARLPDRTEPVEYAIDMWTVSPARAAAWRDLLSQDAPLNSHLPLRQALSQPTIQVMAVSDRGTSGLGGPTRADEAVAKGHDFVSFVRNIGEPRDTELGGGTYGFGKGIFYLVSKVGTILLHTRCKVDGGYETRLMGCALWKSYVANKSDGERRYTGRHWWGDTTGEVVEPWVGAEADAVAHRLGLRPFGDDETGTTIIIIDPLLEGRDSPAEAAGYLAETIAWHLWPKMLESSDGRPAMRFSMTCNGVDYPVPDPRATRPLNLFIAAYEAMEGHEGKDLYCLNPKKFLGRLGLVKRPAPALEATAASRMVDIENAVHHVCLMRPAELVVTYRPGPKPPSEYQHYAGVFRADPALDETYAKAEPPTHDAWNPQSLESPERTYVNTTFRRIDEALNALFDLGGVTRGDSAKVALGAASAKFASLVGGVWGTGGATNYGKPGSTEPTSRNPSPAPSGSSKGTTPDRTIRHRPRVEYVDTPYYGDRLGIPVLIQAFRLPVPGPQQVRIDLAVALAGPGGRETDPPLGAAMPSLLGWEDPGGSLHTTPSHVIEGGDGSTWRAIVRPARDTMTEIDIFTEAVQRS